MSGHPGGHPSGHPNGHHGPRPGGPPGADEPVHPLVEAATPSWTRWAQASVAWVAAAATALLFVRLGSILDTGEVGSTVALAVLAVIAAGCAAAGPWFADASAARTERHLRHVIVQRVFDLGVVRTAGRSGDLLSVATDTAERTAQYRAGFLGPITGALTTPLLVLAIMAITVDPVTAGWLVLLLVLVPLTIGGFQRLVRPIGAAYRRSQAQLTAAFLGAIQALDTLVYARAATRVGADLARRGEAHRRQLMRLLAGNQLLILVVDAAFSLTVVVAAAGIATARVSSGAITFGEAVAIVLMTTLVIGPVDVVGQFFYIGIAGRASQARIGALLGPPTRPRVTTAAASTSGIELTDVTAGWSGDRPVFSGLSLRIQPGERVAVVGPSGIGKSTVAAVLQGHLSPSAGHVTVGGIDVSQDPEAARRQLAVVDQRAFLFLGSIADNLRLADPDADEARLWEALDMAGLRAEVEAMPARLDTQVGERGRLLSGGQAQRLAIARAWLRDAPILLLDEPTSQVDLAGEAAILAALDRIAAGRTVVMIAHRPGAILAADRVIDLAAEVAR